MRRRPSRGARAVRALRAFATLVAFLLVGAQLTSIGHHVLVAHYLCAEHGTLHHGEAPVVRSAEPVLGQAAAPASSGDHGSHDDCVFPARTPAELADVAPLQVIATTPESFVELAVRAGSSAHDAIPLLALAPKLSPPRA